jgi:hypothetical protein
MPYYNAYTFVLSRQQEYEADRTAVTVFGATASAAALVRSTLLGRWFEQHFWPTLYRQAAHRPQPAFMPYGAMRAAFDASHGQWARPELLAAAWSEQSGLDDTHPALRDRLAACGQTAQLPPPATTCAADVLLGPATTRRLIAEFDHAWWSAERKDWRARCREASQGRARLAELAELATLTGPAALALPDMFEYALLSAELQSVAVAAPLLLHLLARPGGPFPRADYVYGAMLLEAGDARGLLHLEAAAGADHGLTDAAGRLGYSFVLRHDGGAAAEAWWEQLVTTA